MSTKKARLIKIRKTIRAVSCSIFGGRSRALMLIVAMVAAADCSAYDKFLNSNEVFHVIVSVFMKDLFV